jgi:hypothetical protein
LPEADDPVELKNTLTKVRNERKDIERSAKSMRSEYEQKIAELANKLDQYKSIDVDEYSQLKEFQSKYQEEQEKRKMEEAEAQKDWETLKEQMLNRHKSEMTSYQERIAKDIADRDSAIEKMQKSLYKSIAEAEYIKEISDAKGKIKLLSPHILPHLSVEEFKDSLSGEISHVTRIKDSNGKIRINPSTGEPMSMKELIAEIKEMPDFKDAFEWEKKLGGSDSVGNVNQPQNSDNPFVRNSPSFNLTRQGEIKRTDPALAARLMAEAGIK